MNTQLPAGKYFIGDPGMVLDASWDEVLQCTDFFTQRPTSFKGSVIWGGATIRGNGIFIDQNGAEYQVEDGLLAAIPIELIENPGGEEHGTVVDSAEGLTVSVKDGFFWFGTIAIDTNAPLVEADPTGHGLDAANDHFI